MLVWSYLRSVGFDEDQTRASLLNDGDDCVLIFERSELYRLAGLPAWFANLGFIMEVEAPVYELEKVVFCQSQPVEIEPGVYRMIRDPRVTLSKDCHVVKPVNSKSDWNYYRHAISQCGLSLAGDVPVYNEFYSCLGRGVNLTKPLKRRYDNRQLETGADYLAIGMSPKYKVPTTTCRVSFAKAFNIWPDEQVSMEMEYSKIVPGWQTPERRPATVDLFHLFHR
jgi:hypothetical protein